MSAPHVHLQGFSAPVVNGGVVEILCTLGLKPAVLTGSSGLLCSLARDILAACGQQLPAPVVEPKRPAGPKPLHAKFRAILAELERDSSHGRQASLCRDQGVRPSSFIAWRRQHEHAALSTVDNPRA